MPIAQVATEQMRLLNSFTRHRHYVVNTFIFQRLAHSNLCSSRNDKLKRREEITYIIIVHS